MEKYKFTLIELVCVAIMLFTYFGAEGNGLLLVCSIILILDAGMRFLKSHGEEK